MKYNNWIYRCLDFGLAVNNNKEMEVVIKDTESVCSANCVFDSSDSAEDIINEIGKEVYSWLQLMLDYSETED